MSSGSRNRPATDWPSKRTCVSMRNSSDSFRPAKRGPGLAYLFFGDVDNDGLYDVIAVDGSDATFTPKTEDIGGRFWLNKGGFRFEEATARCGLASLNNRYADWYEFFGAEVSPALTRTNDLQAFRVTQPGLEPMRPIDLRPYHAGVIFADFNNDTWLDFVILDRREPKAIETRSILFMNQGHGVFKPVPTTVSGLNGTGISGEAADLNNDGLVDLLIAADPDNSGIANDPRRYESMVFLNTGLHGGRENHWLRLRFSGITHARLLGARIEIFEPGSTKRLGTRGIYSNHSYKSGSPPEAHFGLGKTRSVDVSVHLLGGEHFTVKDVQGDRYLDLNVAERAVREVTAKEAPPPSTTTSAAPKVERETVTWLRAETFSCGGQTHIVQIYKCLPFAKALGLAANETDIACEFALIPGGSSTMGSSQVEQDTMAGA